MRTQPAPRTVSPNAVNGASAMISFCRCCANASMICRAVSNAVRKGTARALPRMRRQWQPRVFDGTARAAQNSIHPYRLCRCKRPLLLRHAYGTRKRQSGEVGVLLCERERVQRAASGRARVRRRQCVCVRAGVVLRVGTQTRVVRCAVCVRCGERVRERAGSAARARCA